MVTLEHEVYERNIQAWGYEKQRKIRETSILITGSDMLSQMLCLNLGGLGMGRLIIADNGRNKGEMGPLTFDARNKKSRKSRVEMIAEKMNQMFPLTYTLPLHTRPNAAILTLEIPDLIVAASETGIDVLKLISKSCNIPLIYPPTLESNHSYSSISACIIAALMADEIRELISNEWLETSDSIDNVIKMQDLEFASNLITELESIVDKDYSALSALIIGAGSLGNFAGLHAALLGIGRIDIIDFDRVEIHNLNRQVLLYGSVGKYKSRVLSNRLREVNPRIRARGFTEKLTSKIIPRIPRYDAVFSCVDNSYARLLINRYAIERDVPLFDSGTSAVSGNMNAFIPGETPCLDCRLNLRKMADGERKMQRERGCSLSAPGVIIPNAVMASLMLAEFVRYIDSREGFSPRRIRYSAADKRKIYEEKINMKSKKRCRCSKLGL